MDPDTITIAETSDMDAATDSGVIEVPPNSEETILMYRTRGQFALFAIGATDNQGCEFKLKHGEDTVYQIESPLGQINDPFSFKDKYGDSLLCDKDLEYVVQNNSDSTKEFVCRFHLGVP